ncbi:uncharacterized protein PHALS_07638 [Plasmopara halstedii]|uniref:Uncharacterized protein n=1 Tax=Plasmopara halstedii TaxID=4781 RepID=A0A0P1B738_PLAHL|nr:uncharacterized protein PHALS_07638 [Plasmopara halstedii]CEG49901.1 hypothetical protein PHALS_07638 [Plasmopara halstedii]|eukprot:XP_024586270.1 hypothetical protein PHALS_07638 [Plasmopara halstedii]
MSPALKRGVHTPPGKYDQKKGKTGLVLYEGKGLPRLPGKRPNPRALAVRYRPICGAMINLQKLHQGKLSLCAEETAKVVAAHNRIRELEIDTNNLVQLIQNMQASHNELNQNLYRAEAAYNQLLEDNLLTKSENANLAKLQEQSTNKLNALSAQIETLKQKDHISDTEKRELTVKLIAANEKIDELVKQVVDYKDIISTTRSAAKRDSSGSSC